MLLAARTSLRVRLQLRSSPLVRGALFRALEKTYSSGLYYIIATGGVSIGLLLSGQLAVRMREFLSNVSVAEAMGDMYGKTVQLITAMSGIMAKTGAVAIQFQVIPILALTIWNSVQDSTQVIATLANNPMFDIRSGGLDASIHVHPGLAALLRAGSSPPGHFHRLLVSLPCC